MADQLRGGPSASIHVRRAAAALLPLLLGACACLDESLEAPPAAQASYQPVVRTAARPGERASVVPRPPIRGEAIQPLPPAPPAAARPAAGPASKVVLHVALGSPARLEVAITTALEIVEHFSRRGANAAVELVVEAGAADALSDEVARSDLAAVGVASPGVNVVVCESGSAGSGVDGRRVAAQVPGARWVPSCGARIIELRRRGYAYIRP